MGVTKGIRLIFQTICILDAWINETVQLRNAVSFHSFFAGYFPAKALFPILYSSVPVANNNHKKWLACLEKSRCPVILGVKSN